MQTNRPRTSQCLIPAELKSSSVQPQVVLNILPDIGIFSARLRFKLRREYVFTYAQHFDEKCQIHIASLQHP
ncbi:hypothetical protein PHAVU_002G104400 [Phaseolus vulgaris]|uniref:Uncharacterized protein n=1 Tax=Phaseolus vulgaris TaxID=3885 RepID=V7CKN5_PHAVU|nr:hypothetical protein PHAVU_002G104400g [Phaseolus vulgaris]ESW29855.1 hypothetical protein PHAVU_002G104400g [Phaseolus vulgaris]